MHTRADTLYSVVQMLPKIGQYPPLQTLLNRQRLVKTKNGHSGTNPLTLQVLELGAGTGLVRSYPSMTV
jgi:hypothetical protein